MKKEDIIRVKYEGDYCTDDELAEYALEEIYKLNPDKVVYSYGSGSYEGSGSMLILKDNKWYEHNMGHCSCYGPTDHIDLKRGFDSIEALLANCSAARREELQPLVAAITTEQEKV